MKKEIKKAVNAELILLVLAKAHGKNKNCRLGSSFIILADRIWLFNGKTPYET